MLNQFVKEQGYTLKEYIRYDIENNIWNMDKSENIGMAMGRKI